MSAVEQIARQNPPQSGGQLLSAISKERGGVPVIALVIAENSYLTAALVEPFYEALRATGAHDAIDLFVESDGGQTEVAWPVVCLLREHAKRIGALIPARAMSGATHIALAAETLVMGPVSALGSVDPKRTHHLLPAPDVPHSVQDLKHCIEFIDRQWTAGKPTLGWWERRARARQVGQIVTELFGKVHPLAIGALEQSYELARLITRKVLLTRTDFAKDDPRVSQIVDRLAGQYYSHAFFIHRTDVAKDLGLPVIHAPEALWQAMRQLRTLYRDEAKQLRNCQGGKLQYVGFIESTKSRWVCARTYGADGKPTAEEWVNV